MAESPDAAAPRFSLNANLEFVRPAFPGLKMGATLAGVPFYEIRECVKVEQIEVPLPGGVSLPIGT